MRTAAILFAGPVGYLLLTGFLLSRIRPLPIAVMSDNFAEAPRREAIAA